MSFRNVYGNDYSENGWRMVNRDECVLITGLEYMDTAPVRAGYAAEALSAWAHWYDKNVPGEIVSPTWGWSATNDVSTSNHLSGTALDLNAPQYPWHGTVMRDKYPQRYAAILKGIDLFEGIIFWGASWTDSRDEMHFQLNQGTAAGTGASERLIDFVHRRVKDGQLVGSGGDSGAGGYSPAVIDAYRQVSDRFGWV